MHRRNWIVAALTMAMPFLSSSALAQAWPARPIKLVVPFAAGTGSEIGLRLLIERLSLALKQPVVIENRPGGGSTLGTDVVAKAAPDGQTILVGGASVNTVNPRGHFGAPVVAIVVAEVNFSVRVQVHQLLDQLERLLELLCLHGLRSN